MTKKNPSSTSTSTSFESYPPSWVDEFADFVTRSRLSYWLICLLLFAAELLLLIQIVVQRLFAG
ncbi:MAG: hypothetical protein E4G99_08680 [Anaerolineales bacterium]|nr:MAG: hypothetical protein E4G99_08680 [Anaerolineales bacterium]